MEECSAMGSETQDVFMPQLSLPEAEAEAVRAAYAKAKVILEYGSGATTVMASQMVGKTIFSVESDKACARKMNAMFDQTSPASSVLMHYANIGPTKKWGKPQTDSQWRKFPGYPLSVWSRLDFKSPDTVLIDGRFRAACFLAVLFKTDQPVEVYFDDYSSRKCYHVVEKYAQPEHMVGRMAHFKLEPRPIPKEDLLDILNVFNVAI